MALFPFGQLTEADTELFPAAINSMILRGDESTGWSMGWKINLWARARRADRSHAVLRKALKHSTTYGTDQGQGGIYYNLFDSHAPFQIDGNFGVCSGIAEMLMQSAHGYINVLPALPKVWEDQGEVKGMKAMGNFTVNFNWKNGKCEVIRIHSHAGAPLRVRCTRAAKENFNEAIVVVNGKQISVEVDEHGIATIPCEKGDHVAIDFIDGAGIDVIETVKKKTKVYSLDGREVTKMLPNTIYIVDGKKVMLP
jgi:alpha-L-fucosidase 2